MVNKYLKLLKQLLDSVCAVRLRRSSADRTNPCFGYPSHIHPVIVKYCQAHNKSMFTNDEIKFKS